MARRCTDLPLELSLMLAKYRDWNPFFAKTEQPEAAQRWVLRNILAKQAGTEFGAKHRFASLRTYEEYAREVPICTYEDLCPGIEAQEKTREPILTASQPILFTQTSGTTGRRTTFRFSVTRSMRCGAISACLPTRNGRAYRRFIRVVCC